MNTKTKTQTVGALAPQKEPLFSINATKSDIRIRYINSAPPIERNSLSQTRRIRAD
jgi:hypothetical protein